MKRITGIYRNAYSGLSPATWWLSVVMLINRSGTMVVPFMALYLTEALHYSISRAGIVMAIFGLGAICGGVIGGKLTDMVGFFRVQLAALLCGGILFLVLGQMRSFPAICACAFVLSVLNDAFRPANSTAIAQYSNEQNRTRCYSLNRLSINLGWALGGAIGGFVAGHNYHLLFWIDGFTNIGAALLLFLVLSPSRNVQTPSKNEKKMQTLVKVRSPYTDTVYIAFIVLTICFAYGFFQLFSTISLFYRQQLHLTPFTIGLLMAVNGLIIAVLEMVLVFALEHRRNKLHYISTGVLLIAVSFLVFNLLPGTVFLASVAMLIFTAGEMLSMPFMNTFMITRTTPANRGQYAGLYTVAWSVAQVLGPYTGTQIADRFGFRVLWWFVGCIGIATAIGFKYLQWRTQTEKPLL